MEKLKDKVENIYGMYVISEDSLKELLTKEEFDDFKRYSTGSTMPILSKIKNYFFDYDVYDWIRSK